jgi:hypothetical protein
MSRSWSQVRSRRLKQPHCQIRSYEASFLLMEIALRRELSERYRTKRSIAHADLYDQIVCAQHTAVDGALPCSLRYLDATDACMHRDLTLGGFSLKMSFLWLVFALYYCICNIVFLQLLPYLNVQSLTSRRTRRYPCRSCSLQGYPVRHRPVLPVWFQCSSAPAA